jgi:hypothetical protein
VLRVVYCENPAGAWYALGTNYSTESSGEGGSDTGAGARSYTAEWLKQVNLVPNLNNVALDDADRRGHRPQLFKDLISWLHLAGGGGEVNE